MPKEALEVMVTNRHTWSQPNKMHAGTLFHLSATGNMKQTMSRCPHSPPDEPQEFDEFLALIKIFMVLYISSGMPTAPSASKYVSTASR